MYTNEWSHGHFIVYHNTTLTNLKDVWFIINLVATLWCDADIWLVQSLDENIQLFLVGADNLYGKYLEMSIR